MTHTANPQYFVSIKSSIIRYLWHCQRHLFEDILKGSDCLTLRNDFQSEIGLFPLNTDGKLTQNLVMFAAMVCVWRAQGRGSIFLLSFSPFQPLAGHIHFLWCLFLVPQLLLPPPTVPGVAGCQQAFSAFSPLIRSSNPFSLSFPLFLCRCVDWCSGLPGAQIFIRLLMVPCIHVALSLWRLVERFNNLLIWFFAGNIDDSDRLCNGRST